MKYPIEIQLKAIDLHLSEDLGYLAIAQRLNLKCITVTRWIRKYKAIGMEDYMKPRYVSHFSQETKILAVERILAGETYPDVCIDIGVKDKRTLRDWVKRYSEGGPESLAPKLQGRKSKSRLAKNTLEETLEEKCYRLELENAALKKSIALARQQPSKK